MIDSGLDLMSLFIESMFYVRKLELVQRIIWFFSIVYGEYHYKALCFYSYEVLWQDKKELPIV